LKKAYLRRLRLVLGTELSAKNKIQATASLAVPVFRYSSELLTGTKKNHITQRQMQIACMFPENREEGV
jgi:ribosomal protein L17